MSIIQPFKPTVVELKDSELYQLILEHLVPFTEMSKKWDAFVESLKHTNRFSQLKNLPNYFQNLSFSRKLSLKGQSYIEQEFSTVIYTIILISKTPC